MADDRAFFQIAAALLPALMFGALLTDRLRPPKTIGRHYPDLVLGVVTAATFLLLAETLAIRAAITGEPTTLERVVVASAVMIASGATLAAVLHPWIVKLPEGDRTRQTVGVIALVLIVVVGSIRTLDSAVSYSTTDEKADEIEALIPQIRDAQERESTALIELNELSERRRRLLAGRETSRERAQARTLKFLIDTKEADLEAIQQERHRLLKKQAELAEDLY